MSEPRKLHTGGAHGGQAAASDQSQYEAARRAASTQAPETSQQPRRSVRQPAQSAQGRTLHTHSSSAAAAPAAQQPAQRTVRRTTAPQARQTADGQAMPQAQRQASGYRSAAEHASYQSQRRQQAEQVPAADEVAARARRQQPRRSAYDYDAEVEAPASGIRFEDDTPKAAHHAPKAAAGGTGRRPPHDDEPPAPKKGRRRKNDGTPYTGKGKKRKKGRWWKALLATLLVICLIFGGTYAFIVSAISPNLGSVKLDRLLNTPKEFQDDEFNFLMVGIDRSTQKAGDDKNDAEVGDGNTDMILYVHFNNVTGEMKMLQIPRDTMVSTDRSVSANYRINNVAKTQATEAGGMNMAALCEQVATMYQLPVDGYMTIRLEMLVELVDLFGGIELYVPQTMDYGGSHLNEGYQTLDGNACEFLLRTRHIYPDGDIGRLNMQRQFYSALFRRLKSIGNIWDVAKLTPAVLNYMETDISVSKLVSFAVSMLKIDSSKIMICQMPVKMGQKYNGESVVYSARQEDADLLNTYFRENTGTVDASALQLCDSISELGFDVRGLTSTDPNVQYMGTLNDEAAAAQQSNNLDGSHQVEYVDSDSTDSESAADSAS